MGHHRPEPAIKNFRLQGRSENELASAEYFSAESKFITRSARGRPNRAKKKPLVFSKGLSAFVNFISFFQTIMI